MNSYSAYWDADSWLWEKSLLIPQRLCWQQHTCRWGLLSLTGEKINMKPEGFKNSCKRLMYEKMDPGQWPFSNILMNRQNPICLTLLPTQRQILNPEFRNEQWKSLDKEKKIAYDISTCQQNLWKALSRSVHNQLDQEKLMSIRHSVTKSTASLHSLKGGWHDVLDSEMSILVIPTTQESKQLWGLLK